MTRTPTPTLRTATIGALTAAAVLLTGCGTTDPGSSSTSSSSPAVTAPVTDPGPGALPECPTQTAGPVVLSLGAHANSPAPTTLPALVQDRLNSAIDTGSTISVVNLDGKPTIAWSAAFTSDADNGDAIAQDRGAFTTALTTAITTTHALTPQVDDLTGLTLGARQATSTTTSTTDTPTLIQIDPGLQTMAPLDFTQGGLLTAQPAEIVTFLTSTHTLPDLRGVQLFLAGLADTADPQPRPTDGDRKNLTAIYTAIAAAGNARCLTVLDTPMTTPATTNVPPVTIVPITPPPTFTPPPSTPAVTSTPAPPAPTPGPTLPDDATYGFEPDTATLRDPAAAATGLTPLITWLTTDPAHRTVTLTGTTARVGDDTGQQQLGQHRADTIAALLQQGGVTPQQITTTSTGSHFPGYQPDHDTNGNLLPAPAAANRTVTITTTQH